MRGCAFLVAIMIGSIVLTVPAAVEASPLMSMTCTDSTTGLDYTASYDGSFVRLKGAGRSGKLPVLKVLAGVLITKKNAKGIFTNVSFNDSPLINFFDGSGSKAYRQDPCRGTSGDVVNTAVAPSSEELLRIERFFAMAR